MKGFYRLFDHRGGLLQGLVVCLLFALAVHYTHAGERLNLRVLDRQFMLLQNSATPVAQHDVVVVGIDAAAFESLPEPFQLWHPHLGNFLRAMAAARPAVLGLDISMPERSYQFLVPGYDLLLLQGLQTLRGNTPLVLAQRPDERGAFRPLYPPYATLAGEGVQASATLCSDADGVVRRFDPNLCTVNAQGLTLAEKMAAHLDKKNRATGLVNFALGRPFDYVPFKRVLEWQARGDAAQLAQTFGGKAVLLGVVAPSGERVRVPLALAAWMPSNRRLPEVVMQAQILRSLLDGDLIRIVPAPAVLLLTLCAALFWFGRSGWIKLAVLGMIPFLLLPVSTWQLGRGWYLPVAGILISAVFAFLVRLLFEAVMQMRQRNRLRGVFGEDVGRGVLRDIAAGHLDSGMAGVRSRLVILSARIRGFTQRSEKQSPQEVVALLNDYFSAMAVAIHQCGGRLDKFSGEGLTAFFGAPQALECPEKNALEAAQEMLLRLRQINAALREQNIEPIETGIALHAGEVIIGYIGSANRRDYTIIGEAAELAVKLELLGETLGYPLVCTAEVARAVGNGGGMHDCGEQSVMDGRLAVFGWNPPLLAQQ